MMIETKPAAWDQLLRNVVTRLLGVRLDGEFHPGSSAPLAKFKNLIAKLREVQGATRDEKPVAESIPLLYLRAAAVRAYEERIAGLQALAAQIVEEILSDWNVAKATAEALVAYLTGEVAAKKAQQQRQALPCRYLFQTTLHPDAEIAT